MSGLGIQLHPLVVLNLSDHFTRDRYRGHKKMEVARVVGFLLGRQQGRELEIVNSIEICFKQNGKELIIDEKFAQERMKNYKEMFKDLDVVGWYTAMGAVNTKKPLKGMAEADLPSEDDLRLTKEKDSLLHLRSAATKCVLLCP